MKRLNKLSMLTLAIVPMAITLMLCIANYYSVSGDNNNMLLETYSKVDNANVTTAYGFGLKLQVYNRGNTIDLGGMTSEQSEGITEELIYNEKAGNIDDWADQINHEQFKKYEQDLRYVNGAIIDTDTSDESKVVYTFENGKILNVNMTTEVLREVEFESSVDESNKIIETSTDENGVTCTKYDNGIVKIERTRVEGMETLNLGNGELKLNYSISIINMLIHYLILLVVEVLIYIAVKKVRKADGEIHSH